MNIQNSFNKIEVTIWDLDHQVNDRIISFSFPY